VVFETSVAADSGGYAGALGLAEQHAPGQRACAVEGTGSYGAGLTRFLTGRGERCSRSDTCEGSGAGVARPTRSTPFGLPASVLTQERPATPRNQGEREGDPDREARTAAARPAWRRAAPRGPCRALLVTRGPDQERRSVRPPRRRRPDPRLLRTNDPLPTRPQRRPTTQPGPSTRSSSPDDAHTPPRLPASNGASKKAKRVAKPTAASNATSPATSSRLLENGGHRPLDKPKHHGVGDGTRGGSGHEQQHRRRDGRRRRSP
jgi:hypothetical protein